MCVRLPHFKAYGEKWNQAWLIAALATIAMATGTAWGQITIRPTSYVRCLANSPAGSVISADILSVFNTSLQALAASGVSSAVGNGTFLSSPGYALMRLDVNLTRDKPINSYAWTTSSIVFDLTESMEYELTGEYVYLGDESGLYEYSLKAPGCIYCGVQL